MANIPRPGRAILACGGKPPERRNRSPSAEGKERRGACPWASITPSCSPHGVRRVPPGSLRAAPNAAATGSASRSPPRCSLRLRRPLPSPRPIQMVIHACFFLRFPLFYGTFLSAATLLCPLSIVFFPVSADKIRLQNPEYFAQSTVYKNARIQYNDREHHGCVRGVIWKNPPLRSGP